MDNATGTIVMSSEEIKKLIRKYYEIIPTSLKNVPDSQERCLQYLMGAEESLNKGEFIQSRIFLTRIDIEINRLKSSKTSFFIVVTIVYMFAVAGIVFVASGALGLGTSAADMNKILYLSIPEPIWFWAVVGSFTSMLLRAGTFPLPTRPRH